MGKAPPRDSKKRKPQHGFDLALEPTIVAAYTRHKKKLAVNPAAPKWQNARVERQQRLNEEAAKRLAANEILLTEQEGFLESDEKRPTFDVRQEELIQELDLGSRSKLLELRLSFGPYYVDYTPNGKYLLLGGAKGGLGVLNCADWSVQAEANVRETVRSVRFLNNDQRFATAQRKYIHIYDEHAVEVHILRDQQRVTHLEYLPYHWLLCGLSELGNLSWTDVSDGRLVSKIRDPLLRDGVLAADPWSAALAVGNGRGNISLWTPGDKSAAVVWQAHRGNVTSMAFVDSQHHLATAGGDMMTRFWDLRHLAGGPIHQRRNWYGCSPDLAVSGTGLLAGVSGGTVEVWQDPCRSTKAPYLYYRSPAAVSSIRFRPYEDFLTVGHADGLSTMVVPGGGVANFDSYAANPYETRKSKSARTVKSLLDKLPAESISIDFVS